MNKQKKKLIKRLNLAVVDLLDYGLISNAMAICLLKEIEKYYDKTKT